MYFPAQGLPLDEVIGRIRQGDPFTYVRIGSGGGAGAAEGAKYLEVLYQRPADAARYAPGWLMFPQRPYAVWVFIIAVLGYAMLPWGKVPEGAAVYSRVRSAIVPDLLGTGMAAMFFSLPILILTYATSSSSDFSLLSFDGGWAWLTIILWAFAAGGVSIVIVSLWYATFAMLILPDRLRRVTLLGEGEWPYADMLGVEAVQWSPPRWFKVLMLIGALLNWRHAGAMILGATRGSSGIRIRCRDGRTLDIWVEGMTGCGRVFGALKRAGCADACGTERDRRGADRGREGV